MALPKTLTNFTAFVDGIGYAGLVTEGTPPVLMMKTEEYAGGGMVGTVDISMGRLEKMEASLKFGEYNPALLGMLGRNDVSMSLRGAQGPENNAVIWEMRGLMSESDAGAFSVGKNEMTLKMVARYLKITIDGEEVVEVDLENFVFRSGGVDQMEGTRSALGV